MEKKWIKKLITDVLKHVARFSLRLITLATGVLVKLTVKKQSKKYQREKSVIFSL